MVLWGEHALRLDRAVFHAPEAGDTLLPIDGGAVLPNGLHGALPDAQPAVGACLGGGGGKAAALATLFVGEVPRGREALPPRLKVLPGLQGKGPILEEVLRIGPAQGDGAVGVLPHQGGPGKGQEAALLAEAGELQQGVVKIPVAIGDGDNAGGVLAPQGGEALQGPLEHPAPVYRRPKDYQVLGGKHLLGGGGGGHV